MQNIFLSKVLEPRAITAQYMVEFVKRNHKDDKIILLFCKNPYRI